MARGSGRTAPSHPIRKNLLYRVGSEFLLVLDIEDAPFQFVHIVIRLLHLQKDPVLDLAGIQVESDQPSSLVVLVLFDFGQDVGVASR